MGVDGLVDKFLILTLLLLASCSDLLIFMVSVPLDKDGLWKDTLGLIRLSVSPANFSTWFAPTFIVGIKEVTEDRRLVEVGCPSSFIADTLERRYFGLLQDSLNQVSGKKNDLSFSVRQPSGPRAGVEPPLFLEKEATENREVGEALKKAGVRPGFTFDNFAVSDTNQMAHAAAEAVSDNPGSTYNPLFIWGGVGVGKTHLMLAIAHRVLVQNSRERVLYCTGEEFTTGIIDAIRTKTTPFFRKKYRDLRLLMVDDIQFIAGKTAVQDEFFHTFNTIIRAGGQIVLTSDTPPGEILKLAARLKSRLEAGLTIDISPPDFELRTAIALIKAGGLGIDLGMAAAQTIAANIESPRRIRGFLVRLISETKNKGVGPTEDVIIKLLNKTNGELRPLKNIRPQEVVLAVSNYFSVGKRSLLGPNRSANIALPRQILMYLLRIEFGLPLQEVGRLVGGRDHTTVMHGVGKISVNLSTNEKLREDILRIKQSFLG